MFTSAASPGPGPDGGGLARELSTARARLESQERQIQELNHRVANSLQLAADMLTFEQLRARDPLASAALEASRARLVAVGELHRYLYDHAERPSVDLKPFLTGLCQAKGKESRYRDCDYCSFETWLTNSWWWHSERRTAAASFSFLGIWICFGSIRSRLLRRS